MQNVKTENHSNNFKENNSIQMSYGSTVGPKYKFPSLSYRL